MSLEIPVIPDEDPKPRSEKMEVEDVDSDSDSFSDSDQESDSDGSKEKVIHCKVCMKDGVHMSHDCPYLVIIREPKDTPIGKDYMIVCHCCSLRDHGHPDGTWLGCAVMNFYESSMFRKPGVTYHKPDGDDEDDILD